MQRTPGTEQWAHAGRCNGAQQNTVPAELVVGGGLVRIAAGMARLRQRVAPPPLPLPRDVCLLLPGPSAPVLAQSPQSTLHVFTLLHASCIHRQHFVHSAAVAPSSIRWYMINCSLTILRKQATVLCIEQEVTAANATLVACLKWYSAHCCIYIRQHICVLALINSSDCMSHWCELSITHLRLCIAADCSSSDCR